jgi:hypothetical protein
VFRNVTRNTRVHADMNAAFTRAETWLAAQLAALPAPRRTAVTTEISTVLGRGTWSGDVTDLVPTAVSVFVVIPLSSEIWQWYKPTRGDGNAAPASRWCSTCGSHRIAGRCPRCDD